MQDSANLFEVSVPGARLLQQCRREIKMLKQLWDYIFLVRTSIDEWKTTPWKDIDVENMDMECKKFSKVRENVKLTGKNQFKFNETARNSKVLCVRSLRFLSRGLDL